MTGENIEVKQKGRLVPIVDCIAATGPVVGGGMEKGVGANGIGMIGDGGRAAMWR
jgi:hypothetical protein